MTPLILNSRLQESEWVVTPGRSIPPLPGEIIPVLDE